MIFVVEETHVAESRQWKKAYNVRLSKETKTNLAIWTASIVIGVGGLMVESNRRKRENNRSN